MRRFVVHILAPDEYELQGMAGTMKLIDFKDGIKVDKVFEETEPQINLDKHREE